MTRKSRYRLAKKIIIHLEERGGEFCVWAPKVRQYGVGSTPAAAMRYLWRVLEEYYEMLEEAGMDGLGQTLQKDLQYLRSALASRIATQERDGRGRFRRGAAAVDSEGSP